VPQIFFTSPPGILLSSTQRPTSLSRQRLYESGSGVTGRSVCPSSVSRPFGFGDSSRGPDSRQLGLRFSPRTYIFTSLVPDILRRLTIVRVDSGLMCRTSVVKGKIRSSWALGTAVHSCNVTRGLEACGILQSWDGSELEYHRLGGSAVEEPIAATFGSSRRRSGRWKNPSPRRYGQGQRPFGRITRYFGSPENSVPEKGLGHFVPLASLLSSPGPDITDIGAQ
jgi:hypothetical protein